MINFMDFILNIRKKVMEPGYVKLTEIKPVLSGYIRKSQGLLKRYPVPNEKVVHDVRVLMKKSRAVLRLVDSQVISEFIRKDIVAFRDVGRIMSEWRDTSVHRRALRDLRKEFPAIFDGLQDNETITALLEKTEPETEPSPEMKEDLEKIDDLLEKAGYRIRFQSMSNIDPQLLLKELDTTYMKVMDCYIRSRNNPKPEKIHRFRKRVKDFLYQLYFFRPLNPPVIKTLEKRLNGIAQNLGKYNDMNQLIKTIGYKYSDSSGLPALDELIVKIRDRQDKYLSKTWPQAYKIFCPGQKLVNVLGFKLLVI
jgi:CHAD domain-containing protein